MRIWILPKKATIGTFTMVLKRKKMRPDNWLGTTILVAAALLVYGALKVRSERFLFLRLALYCIAVSQQYALIEFTLFISN